LRIGLGSCICGVFGGKGRGETAKGTNLQGIGAALKKGKGEEDNFGRYPGKEAEGV
jgi:hypothetical protein